MPTRRRLQPGPIAALLLLAGLAAWVLLKERPADDARRREGEAKNRLIAFERSAVTGVRIENERGSVRLEKAGDGFAVTAPLRTDADKSAVDEVLSGLESARIERRIGPAGDLKTYGLDPPKATITLETSPGGPASVLRIGDGAPVGGGFFVLPGGGGEVAVAGAGIGDLAKKDLFALRDKSLLAFDPWKVKRARLKRGADTLLLEKPADGWKIQEPIETPADGPTVTDLLSALERLRASAVTSETSSDKDLRRAGLEPATHSLTLLQEGWDVEKTVVFAKKADGTLSARVVGRAPILSVPGDFWEKLTTKLADLRRKEILGLSQYRLETITAARAGTPALTLTRQKDGAWSLTGPGQGTVKADSADLLLRHLGVLKAKSFEDKPDSARYAALKRDVALDLTLTEEAEAPGGAARTQHLVFGAPDRGGMVGVRDMAWRSIARLPAGELQTLRNDFDTLVREATEPKPTPSASPAPSGSPAPAPSPSP